MKLVADVAEPTLVITTIGPVAAPIGTLVVIEVLVNLETIADVPLKLTLRPLTSKLLPLIVTIVPVVPSDGLKPVISGGSAAGLTTKGNAADSPPPGIGLTTLTE